MLEVGVVRSPFGGDKGLTIEETRAHFGSWVIVSSPLTLSHDVNNQTIQDAIWPLISNTEVLAVSQSYAGHSGSPFKEAQAAAQPRMAPGTGVKKASRGVDEWRESGKQLGGQGGWAALRLPRRATPSGDRSPRRGELREGARAHGR